MLKNFAYSWGVGSQKKLGGTPGWEVEIKLGGRKSFQIMPVVLKSIIYKGLTIGIQRVRGCIFEDGVLHFVK